MTATELVQEIGELSVGELVTLTRALQEKFNVSPMASLLQAPVAPPPAVEEVEEQTAFDVVILEAGATKIQVIKVVREVTTLGLKEAKDLVDHLPAVVKEGLSREEARVLHDKLAAQGAKVEIR